MVTVRGANFAGAAVTLDDAPIGPASQSDSEIVLRMPGHGNGYALLKIASASGEAYGEYLFVPPALADLAPGFITTVAGVGNRDGFFRPATQADVRPWGIAVDAEGNIDIVSSWHNRVFRVTPAGVLLPWIGDGTAQWDPTDGLPAALAHISFPRSIALDGAGNAWVSDTYHTIKRVDAKTGIITTVCGTPRMPGFSGDGGPAVNALVRDPNFLAVSPDGTLYFLDFSNARIRRITPDGIITTIAGTGHSGRAGNGAPAIQADLDVSIDSDSDAIALDPRGLLYFGETASGRIRKIDLSSGIITTFHTFVDAQGGAHWPWIRSLAVDDAGNVYAGIAAEIVKLSPIGAVLTSWGKRKTPGFSPDGTPLSSLLIGAGQALAIDREGNLLYTDEAIKRVRRMNFKTGRVEPVAGSPPDIFGVPGPAIGAVLTTPMDDLAFLPNGDLLFASQVALYVFRINTAGTISIEAGNGTFLGPGPVGNPVLGANVPGVAALDVDPAGGYYWANSRPIIYVDPAGIGHYIAGGGFDDSGFAGDGGLAKDALLNEPWDVVRDGDGNLFIADTNNNRIRRIDAKTGIITTVVGNGGPVNGWEGYGRGTFCGDGGPAIDACLNTPYAVAVDPQGEIFISDYENQRIRKVDSSGIITTFAQGHATKLITDANGILFTNSGNTVDRFRPDGRRTAVAGQQDAHGFSGDGGPASAALLSNGGIADGIAFNREGDLFFFDTNNFRIRAIRFGAVLAPPGSTVQPVAGSGQSSPLGGSFALPLEVIVRGDDGVPEPSVRVEFRAPESGATCLFPDGSRTANVITDRNGKAAVTCRAWGAAGSVSVVATPTGSTRSAVFSLTNTTPPRRRAARS